MHAERDHLIKVVFPALRERLEKYRIYLDDIDLRWGVTKEQAENDQVLDLCLQQIDKCRPFFIGILGERYGWVPTQFPIQTLSRQGWVQYHTGKSVTDLEMVYGVFTKSPMRPRAFFYFRDPAALAGMPDDIRSTFTETDAERIAKLADLKQRIRQNGYPLMEPYPAGWDAQAYDRPNRANGRLVGLEAFGERVLEQLWEAIKAEHHLPDAPPPETALDPLAVELDYHERFKESRLRVHVLRKQINDKLLAFAEGDATVACLVTGPSGSGKSASLAQFVMDYQQAHPDALVVPHFIGASPRSTNLREMLRRFCQVLKARLGLAEEVPEEVTKLAVAFREFIGKVPLDVRVLFVIDALNQLDEPDRAQKLGWLPVQFPRQVKVVGSCISVSGKAEPALEAFARRQHVTLVIGPLDDEERQKIIQQVPSLSAKTLDNHQIEQLLANPATTNPLFLLVALEELRGFGSYDLLNQHIADFPREGDTVTAIFTQVIKRLEEEFDAEGVRTILTLLAVARRGLSERELQELVAGLSGADDLFPILRQLRPYLLRRAGLIDFYHRTLFKAVRERYLASKEQQRVAHASLAEFFQRQHYWLESRGEQQRRANTLPPTLRPANLRKVDELPWQLLQAGDWEKSEKVLTDLPFLEAKAEAGLLADLVEDYVQFRVTCPRQISGAAKVGLLERALLQDLAFLERHPSSLFQCMWGSAWWEDSPLRARHCLLALGAQAPELSAGDLSGLLERWRKQKETNQLGVCWLRSLRPPPVTLRTNLRFVARGHRHFVTSVAFAPDGQRLASGSGWYGGSDDWTVRLWDATNGLPLAQLEGHRNWVGAVAFSPDGASVASCSDDGTVRVWDVSGEQQRQCLNLPDARPICVIFLPNGRHLAVADDRGDIELWNIDDLRLVSSLKGHAKGVERVVCSADGAYLVSGSRDGTARLWDVNSGAELLRLEGHGDVVRSVAISRDGRSIITGGWDGTVRVWDIATGAERTRCTGHSDGVESIDLSPDDCTIVSGSRDRTVRLWDCATGAERRCFQGHGARVMGVCFSPDGSAVASASEDGSVRLWDVEEVESGLVPRNHEGDIEVIVFSPDNAFIATGSDDRRVRIWEADTGLERACLVGHEERVVALAFAPGGQVLSGAADGTVRLWDWRRGDNLACWPWSKTNISSVALAPDGHRAAAGAGDGQVVIWDLYTGAVLHKLVTSDGPPPSADSSWPSNPGYPVECLAFSADGRLLAGAGCAVWLWDLEASDKGSSLYMGPVIGFDHIGFAPDGTRIVAWNFQETIVLALPSGAVLSKIYAVGDGFALVRGLEGATWRLCIADEESTIVRACDGTAFVWFPVGFVRSAISSDGRLLAGAVLGYRRGGGQHLYLLRLEGDFPTA